MWELLEKSMMFLIGVIILFEVIIPLIMNKPLFTIFRKSDPNNPPTTPPKSENPLEDVVAETKQVVDQAKEKLNETKTKVEDNLKRAEDLKNKTDNLL